MLTSGLARRLQMREHRRSIMLSSRSPRREITMRVSGHLLLASLLGLATAPAFACYTVFDSANRVLYQSDRPPVDMSRPLHETLPQRFPGGHLVFDEGAECMVISPVAMGDGGPVTQTSSPLLTNETSARRMGANHKTVNGVAVVPSGDVAMKPGVTVLGGPAKR
jgi:hypothetical protein